MECGETDSLNRIYQGNNEYRILFTILARDSLAHRHNHPGDRRTGQGSTVRFIMPAI